MNFKIFLENTEISSDIKKTLSKLPKNHYNLIKDYKIEFQPNNTLQGDSGYIGFIDEEKKKIVIASPWNYGKEFTLLHEIGHAVWKYIVNKEDKKEWKEIAKNTKQKQKQNNEELFCMAYANYYAKNKIEIHNHEKWNKFIKEKT
jgi:Zn-dependent peptidase ImmA (M78 family)